MSRKSDRIHLKPMTARFPFLRHVPLLQAMTVPLTHIQEKPKTRPRYQQRPRPSDLVFVHIRPKNVTK